MKLIISLTVALFIGIATPQQSMAGNNDTPLEVLPCGANLLVNMQTAGWLVMQEADLGVTGLNRFMAIVLTLVATGKKSGFFNDNIGTIFVCGVNAKRITTISIKA